MKIQPTQHKTTTKTGKRNTGSSAAFDEVMRSDSANPVAQVENPPDEPQDAPPQHMASHLKTLEHAIENIEAGEHRQAQEALDALRQALQQQSMLPPRAKEHADTLLAVESKRLETLRKNHP